MVPINRVQDYSIPGITQYRALPMKAVLALWVTSFFDPLIVRFTQYRLSTGSVATLIR